MNSVGVGSALLGTPSSRYLRNVTHRSCMLVTCLATTIHIYDVTSHTVLGKKLFALNMHRRSSWPGRNLSKVTSNVSTHRSMISCRMVQKCDSAEYDFSLLPWQSFCLYADTRRSRGSLTNTAVRYSRRQSILQGYRFEYTYFRFVLFSVTSFGGRWKKAFFQAGLRPVMGRVVFDLPPWIQ